MIEFDDDMFQMELCATTYNWFLFPPCTLPKSDIATEHRPYPKESLSSKHLLSGAMLVSGRVFFMFTAHTWGDDPIWLISFSDQLLQPPTRFNGHMESNWRVSIQFAIHLSGKNQIATSHDLTSKGSCLEGKSSYFQGNLHWWNIISWSDLVEFLPQERLNPFWEFIHWIWSHKKSPWQKLSDLWPWCRHLFGHGKS